jgi:hypothetical protein
MKPRSNRWTLIVTALLAIGCTASRAVADNVPTLDAFAQVNGTQGILCFEDTMSTAMCSATGTGAATGLSGTTSSSASFGTLGMSTTVSVTGPGSGSRFVQGDGDAAADDFLTVAGFHGIGFFTGTFQIDGTVTGIADGQLFVSLKNTLNNSKVSCEPSIPLGTTTCKLSLAVMNGEVIDVFMLLTVEAEGDEKIGVLNSSALFSDTGSITSLAVDDASGNPIPGATVIAASVTVYPAPSVPEPSSVFMLGSGLLGLLGVARSHRR